MGPGELGPGEQGCLPGAGVLVIQQARWCGCQELCPCLPEAGLAVTCYCACVGFDRANLKQTCMGQFHWRCCSAF